AERLGWRALFALFALPMFLWSAAFYHWFRAPAGAGSETDPAKEPTPWGRLLVSGPMWCVCGQQFFRAAGYMFYASWFTTYLREARGLSLERAGVLTSLPLYGVVVGSLVGGAASDFVLARTGSRRLGRQGIGLLSMLLGALCIFVARPIADPDVT